MQKVAYIPGVDSEGTFSGCIAITQDGDISVAKGASTPIDFTPGGLASKRPPGHITQVDEYRNIVLQFG